LVEPREIVRIQNRVELFHDGLVVLRVAHQLDPLDSSPVSRKSGEGVGRIGQSPGPMFGSDP
jgi:hypothetical protein